MSESRAQGESSSRLDPAYLAVLDAVPEAVVAWDEDRVIRLVNDAACTLFGYERDDLVATPVERLIPPDRRESYRADGAEYLLAPRARVLGAGHQLTALHSDGSVVPIDATLTPIDRDEGRLVVALIRSPGMRRREERLFRGVLEGAPDAMVILDDLGHILLVNASAERMFGYERDRLIGQRIEKLVPTSPAVSEAIRNSPHTRPLGMAGDLLARRNDGSDFPVEISLAPLETEEGSLVLASVRDLTARRALEEANARAKDEFFATVSHELRTPLTSLIGYGELMGDLEDLSPQGSQFLSVMMRSAEREMRLVDDLLTLVSIEGTGLAVRPSTVELAEVLRHAVEAARPIAEDCGLDLELVLPGEPALTAGDGDRLGQAVDNLLSNAIKFTPPGGRVRAALRLTQDTVLVEIVDSGDGIAEHEHELVFERLFRGSQAVERHVQGAGLGLPISLAIAKAHGGTIGIISSDETGSVFRLTLPRES